MKDSVTIKSSKYGLEVRLHPEMPFPQLLIEVEKKFTAAAKFFSNSSLAVSFENRKITREEENQLIKVITDTTEITIVCIIDNNKTTEQLYRMILEQNYESLEKQDGQFYKGTLKRRQLLESETSIIVLGNVEAGSKIIAKGNIIVMGRLEGIVHAGAGGDKSAFISALQMNPKIMKISDVTMKRHKLQKIDENAYEPKIAIVDGEHIYIDPLV